MEKLGFEKTMLFVKNNHIVIGSEHNTSMLDNLHYYLIELSILNFIYFSCFFGLTLKPYFFQNKYLTN